MENTNWPDTVTIGTNATVASTVRLSGHAKVLGFAKAQGTPRIGGNAVIDGEAYIGGKDTAVVGNALVDGAAFVAADVLIGGWSWVTGAAHIDSEASFAHLDTGDRSFTLFKTVEGWGCTVRRVGTLERLDAYESVSPEDVCRMVLHQHGNAVVLRHLCHMILYRANKNASDT